jgi:serine/threonine protein kinase
MTNARSVGPYRLVEPLGRGGMGEVWLADDATGAAGSTPRRVAVKLLDPSLAADPVVRARFAREVAALRKVDSPYVAPLLDADVDATVPWLASAYVAGPTLADHVGRHGPLAEAPLRALGVALAAALAAIHAAGVVHRDLTPRNIVLGPDGPRLVDFGIAWFPGAVPVTAGGSTVGTPAWMAPERLASGDATAASDVWSWGAVMAYAARGQPLPPAVTAQMEDLPGWLAPWVRRTTATDPAARPSAAELRTALAGDPTRHVEPEATLLDVTQPAEVTAVHPTRQEQPEATRVFGTGARPSRDGVANRRSARWASAAGVVAVAAGIGAVSGLLASVMVAAVCVLGAFARQFRRAHLPDDARPLPPTWSVVLAGPVVLGVGLVRELGLVVGVIALVALVVVFVVVAGDIT